MAVSASFYAHADTMQALKLHMDDGTDVVYFLNDKPKVSFENQEMIVTTSADSKRLPMEKVSKWTFSMEESDVADLKVDNPRILINADTVTIVSPQNVQAVIFDMNGIEIGAAEGYTITFTPGPGVFIIKINTKTYKIAVR